MFSKAQQSLLQAASSLLQAASELSSDSPETTPKRVGRKPGSQAAQAAVTTAAAVVQAVAPRAKALKGSAVPVPAAPKRMGRPPKVAAQAAAQPAAVAKATKAAKATTPKAAAKAKAVAVAKPAKAAKGAKAADDSKLPTLTERLKIVMGADEIGIDEAIKRLKAKGKKWIPNSGKLKNYISLAFSTHKEDFVRVSRGVYRVGATPGGKGTGGKAAGGKTKGKKTAEVAAQKAEPAPAPVVVEAKPEKVVEAKPEKAERKSKKHVNGVATADSDIGNVLDNPFAP